MKFFIILYLKFQQTCFLLVAAVHQIDELDDFFLLFQFDEFGLRNINQKLAVEEGAFDTTIVIFVIRQRFHLNVGRTCRREVRDFFVLRRRGEICGQLKS